MSRKRGDVVRRIVYIHRATLDAGAVPTYFNVNQPRFFNRPVLWIGHINGDIDFFALKVDGFVGCDFDLNWSWTVTALNDIGELVAHDASYCCNEQNRYGEKQDKAFGAFLCFGLSASV